MEYKPKFDIGQSVYVYGENEPWIIEAIKMYRDDYDGEIHYRYDFDCSAVHYDEDELFSEKPEKKTIYDLKYGDPYIFSNNENYIGHCIYRGDETDHNNINYGYAFMTENEAKKEMKRRKIHEQLKRLAGECEFKFNKSYFYICLNNFKNLTISWNNGEYSPDIVYFAECKDAENAVDEIGEDVLMRDYFGVEV